MQAAQRIESREISERLNSWVIVGGLGEVNPAEDLYAVKFWVGFWGFGRVRMVGARGIAS